MKKSLVALAALAAVSAASAQSSVTLFGVADAWVGNVKGAYDAASSIGPNPTSQTKLGSGGMSGSRWGVRGSEDLGGGLKGNFVIEAGIDIDTGASAQATAANATTGAARVERVYGRQSYVGLSGGFGDLRLGRQYSAYDDLRGATSILGHTTFDATIIGGSWARVGDDYTARIDNMIRYGSPSFGGFSVAVGYGFGENKPANGSAGSHVSAHGLYANGPITVGLGVQQDKGAAAAGATAASESHTLFAGGYDFGVFKLTAGFGNSKIKNANKDTEFHIGASAPFGPVTAALQFSSAKEKNPAGNEVEKGTSIGAQITYALSKRTDTYLGLNSGKVENAAGTTTEKNSVVALGLRHRF
jgi:predicted porin